MESEYVRIILFRRSGCFGRPAMLSCMMSDLSTATLAGEQLLGELVAQPPKTPRAPTMGALQKVRYSHAAMIDLIIENPWISQNEIAARFGYTPAWISNVFASDAFQSAMAVRRDEIIDPALKATVQERFRALVIQSLERLQGFLAAPACPPAVALKAAELGAKALGLGGHAPPPPPPASDRLERLAERIIQLNHQPQGEVIDAQVIEVSTGT